MKILEVTRRLPMWAKIIGVIIFAGISIPIWPFLIGGLLSYWIYRKASQATTRNVLLVIVLVPTLFIGAAWTVAWFDKSPSQSSQDEHTTSKRTTEDKSQKNIPTLTSIPTTLYKVVEVVDGDTIKMDIDGIIQTIRLIGIDTPETKDPRKPVQCFGKEATQKMHALVFGKMVHLEPDTSQDSKDKYNRLLGYIILDDGTNINQMMIADGYAYEYTYQTPYKYQKEFKAAQQEAESNKKGFWADGICISPTPIAESTIPPIKKPVVNTSSGTSGTTGTGQIEGSGYSCDCSKTCAVMSCDEAQYQLSSCGCSARDRDGDGIACDSQCQ